MSSATQILFIIVLILVIGGFFMIKKKIHELFFLARAIKGYGNLEIKKITVSQVLFFFLCLIALSVIFYAGSRTDTQTLQKVGKFFTASFVSLIVHNRFMNKYFCVHNTKKYPFRRI